MVEMCGMMSHILPDMKSVEIATIDCPTTRKEQAWFSVFEEHFIVVSTKKNNE